MPKIAKQQTESQSPQQKPTMRAVRQEVEDIFMRHGYDAGYCRYFMDEICTPYRPDYEAPSTVAVQGTANAVRWDQPYLARILHCQRVYLALSDADRKLLHAGAEDGVKWGGESMKQYLDVVNESAMMQEIGRRDYVSRCKREIEKISSRGKGRA